MKSETEKLVDKMMDLPKSEWRNFIERRRKKTDWRGVATMLGHMVTHAAMLNEYIEQRTGGYCGNKADHDTAVKKTNIVRTKVRQAMGYSIPRAGEFSF